MDSAACVRRRGAPSAARPQPHAQRAARGGPEGTAANKGGIDNWSLWLDVKILARTLWAVAAGTGS